MKKGLHPQLQWISYVTQSGRLINIMMTRIHHVGKVYHFRARREMTETISSSSTPKVKRQSNEQAFRFKKNKKK